MKADGHAFLVHIALHVGINALQNFSFPPLDFHCAYRPQKNKAQQGWVAFAPSAVHVTELFHLLLCIFLFKSCNSQIYGRRLFVIIMYETVVQDGVTRACMEAAEFVICSWRRFFWRTLSVNGFVNVCPVLLCIASYMYIYKFIYTYISIYVYGLI